MLIFLSWLNKILETISSSFIKSIINSMKVFPIKFNLNESFFLNDFFKIRDFPSFFFIFNHFIFQNFNNFFLNPKAKKFWDPSQNNAINERWKCNSGLFPSFWWHPPKPWLRITACGPQNPRKVEIFNFFFLAKSPRSPLGK